MSESVHAWHPEVPQIVEVLHATFDAHAYPAHTHDTWTVLLVDEGAVDYSIDRARHRAERSLVTLLPPHVPHDGRSSERGVAFQKRVLYLAADWLPASYLGAAARNPAIANGAVQSTVKQIHRLVQLPGEALAAESAVWALRQQVQAAMGTVPSWTGDDPLAARLRAVLDDRFTHSLTIESLAQTLQSHPAHVIRAFSRAYGISPHRYVVGRRVDLARHLLLAGHSSSDAAAAAGFYDQSHLTRHFKRTLGTTPGAFAASDDRAVTSRARRGPESDTRQMRQRPRTLSGASSPAPLGQQIA